ncbi:MAG: hypothetical protein ACFFCS_23525 [Candidatus Hodarchaeota archaeon]
MNWPSIVSYTILVVGSFIVFLISIILCKKEKESEVKSFLKVHIGKKKNRWKIIVLIACISCLMVSLSLLVGPWELEAGTYEGSPFLFMSSGVAFLIFMAIPVLIVGTSVFLRHLVQEGDDSGSRRILRSFLMPMSFEHRVDSMKPLVHRHGILVMKWVVLLVIAISSWFLGDIVYVFYHECGHGLAGLEVGGSWIGAIIAWPLSGSLGFGRSPLDPVLQIWIILGGTVMGFCIGIVFLAMLLIPAIRKSFWPSIIMFFIGLRCTLDPIINWLGGALYYTPPTGGHLGDIESYFYTQQLLGTGISPLSVAIALIPVVIAIIVSGLFLATRIWRVHYPKESGLSMLPMLAVTALVILIDLFFPFGLI